MGNICIRERIQSHNSGYNTIHDQRTSHLRPFAVFAFICGFNCDKHLQKHVRLQWEEGKKHLQEEGVTDPIEWANVAVSVIDETILHGYVGTELTFIQLFRE